MVIGYGVDYDIYIEFSDRNSYYHCHWVFCNYLPNEIIVLRAKLHSVAR